MTHVEHAPASTSVWPLTLFWVVVGFLIVAGGVAEFMQLEFSLLPVVLIVAGLALLLSALRRHAP